MPQLSLYVDEETLKKIETGAKIKNTSISKLVSGILNEYYLNNWPEGYTNLFGSLKDEDFSVPNKLSFENDIMRESL